MVGDHLLVTYIRETMQPYPLWADKGLAEYFFDSHRISKPLRAVSVDEVCIIPHRSTAGLRWLLSIGCLWIIIPFVGPSEFFILNATVLIFVCSRVHLLTAVPNDPVDVVGVQTFLHKHTGYPPQRVNAKDGVIAAEFDTDDAAIEVPEAVYLALKIRDNRDIEKIIAPPALRMFQPRSIMLNLAADANLRAVEVSGPFSLVEINKFEGITREIEKRPTRIERSSVNSIVVNSAQELKMPRWLIAASVSSSQQVL